MPDEENIQPAPEPTTTEVPIPQTDSSPVDVPPEDMEAPASPEDHVMVKDENPANEPLKQPDESAQDKPVEPEKTAQITTNPNITIEKTPDTVTIAEVMEPIKTSKPEKPSQKDLWKRFLNTLNIRKKKKLDKILQAITETGKITNDDVEKILHVSDATATRYLNSLEKEGKIKQVGKTGKYTYYEKI